MKKVYWAGASLLLVVLIFGLIALNMRYPERIVVNLIDGKPATDREVGLHTGLSMRRLAERCSVKGEYCPEEILDAWAKIDEAAVRCEANGGFSIPLDAIEENYFGSNNDCKFMKIGMMQIPDAIPEITDTKVSFFEEHRTLNYGFHDYDIYGHKGLREDGTTSRRIYLTKGMSSVEIRDPEPPQPVDNGRSNYKLYKYKAQGGLKGLISRNKAKSSNARSSGCPSALELDNEYAAAESQRSGNGRLYLKTIENMGCNIYLQ